MKKTALTRPMLSLSLVLASAVSVLAQEAPPALAPIAVETVAEPAVEVLDSPEVEAVLLAEVTPDNAPAPKDPTKPEAGNIASIEATTTVEEGDTTTSTTTTATTESKPGAPDVHTTKTKEITTKKLPGGKLLVTSGDGKNKEVRVIDVASTNSADAPMRINFDSQLARVSTDGPVTFMGVAVTQASAELSNHLPLVKGTGLIVQNVSKDSPAQKAGIQENDILTKLDDQILIHPVQLSVLIAGKKEGDTVKVSLLRKAAPQEVSVTLAKNESADASGPGTLKFGDVEVDIAGVGKENQPLRTYVKSLRLDSKDLKAAPFGNGVVEIEGNGGIHVDGDKIKIEADKMRVLRDVLKHRIGQNEADIAKSVEDTIRSQTDALRAAQDKAAAQVEAAKAGAEAAKAQVEALKAEAEAKKKAIDSLEETLRKLKSE